MLAACNNNSECETITTVDSLKREIIIRDSTIQALITRSGMNSGLQYDSILAAAKKIAVHLKEKQFDNVSTYADPAGQLSFSPSAYIDSGAKAFATGTIAGLWNDQAIYHWGMAEGSGDSILLTFKNYYSKYIYNRDFANAPTIEFNAIRRGNTTATTNFDSVYPSSGHVDFYFPNTSSDKFDWNTLRLIFINKGGQWYLRHILHEGYSI